MIALATVLPYIKRFGPYVALALFAIWIWRIDSLRGQYKQQLIEQKKAYENAQADAQLKFDAQVARTKAANQKANENADTKNATVSIVYRDRVLRLPAAEGASCSAGLPKADISEGSNGPGSQAVILKRDDALICAENQSRLEAAHDWAIALDR